MTDGTLGSAQVEGPDDYDNEVGRWLAEIKAYKAKFRPWEEEAKEAEQRFMNSDKKDASTPGARPADNRFSILWSSVRTLQPSIYSRTPQPDITRAFKDKDVVARSAATVLERSARNQIALGDFDEAMRETRDDYLLTARGVTWVRYVPVYGEERTEKVFLQENARKDRRFARTFRREDAAEDDEPIAFKDVMFDEPEEGMEEGRPFINDTYRPVVDEYIEFENISWARFGHRPAPKWRKVEAVWKEELMTRAQLVKRFGKKKGNAIQLTKSLDGVEDEDIANHGDTFKRAQVYEIWDKANKVALWISPGYREGVLDKIDDPLKLKDFFPCPKPVYGTKLSSSLVPTTDYHEFKTQALEIDRLTARISVLTKALKVAGAYNGQFKELERILSSQDNILIPVDGWSMFSEGGGIGGAISFVPLKEVAETLQLLIQIRDQAKRDLFEISGLSDVIRGQSTGPRATATEQRIKGQFAGMRIDDQREQFAKHAKGAVEIGTEIIAEHFSPETLKRMSNWDDSEEAREAQRVHDNWVKEMEAWRNKQGQLLAAAKGGQQPEPPAPPPQEPRTSDQLFEAVVQLLRDQKLRGFEISVSTDDLVIQDQQEDKAQRTEFVTAATNFLKEAVPAAERYPDLRPVLGEMMLFGIRGFRAGRPLEAAFENATEAMNEAAKDQKPDPAQQALQMEAQLKQAEMQARNQEIKIKQADSQSRNQLEQAKLQMEQQWRQQQTQMQLQMEAAKLDLEREKLDLERLRLQFDQPPDTSAHDSIRLEADLEKQERELQMKERELGLKFAQHNKQLVEEEETEGVEPTVVPQATERIEKGLATTMELMMQQMAKMQQSMLENQQRMMRELSQMNAMNMAQATEALSAEREVVRDPNTGRVSGIRVKGSGQVQ